MAVAPLKVLLPVSEMVPAPLSVSMPLPLIRPPKLTALERLNFNAALLAMLPLKLPTVPPEPS